MTHVQIENSPIGDFLYPPNGSDLVFNYLDTVNVTWRWTAGSPCSSDCYLSLWYWTSDTNRWRISYNETQPSNGSALVGLNIAGTETLSQFNFNYTLSDSTKGVFLSEFFNVLYDSTKSPVTWSLISIPQTTSSVPLSSNPGSTAQTSTSSETLAVASKLAPTSSSTLSSPPNSSTLGAPQIAGITVGVALAALLGLTILILFLLRRKTMHTKHGPRTGMERIDEGINLVPNRKPNVVVERIELAKFQAELPVEERPKELYGYHMRHEING